MATATDQYGMVTSEQRKPRRSACDGEPGAPGGFDHVYRSQFAYVWRALRRLGVPPPDIEDLVHDVFVVVHRRFADFDRQRAVKPWLFGIAFRLASENRRRAHNRREIPTLSVDPPGRLPAADALIESDERRQMVLDCLQALSLEQRAVLILVDIDGESPAEVALCLKTPIPTVYSRLRAARVRFAAAVRRAKLRQGDT
jgi:RNA polymerase sigma-70 factor (ECF subfamily)